MAAFREILNQTELLKSMRGFILDPEMSASITGLATELLGETRINIEATSRGLNAKDHGFDPDNEVDIQLDGALAFGVFLKGWNIPTTIYSFDLNPGPRQNSVDILQIQTGEEYADVGVPFKRWEPFGLHLIEMFSEWRGDIGATMVRPVRENEWFGVYRRTSDWYKQGRLRYDITAQRAGYRYDAGIRRFIKYLP